MNTLDMQTKVKVNMIHLAEMQQDACNRRLVRDLKPARFLVVTRARVRLVMLALVILLFVTFFISVTPSF